MNYTQNYQLPQWVETDRILRTDFNDAFDTIDSVLGQVPGKGNCSIFTTSYIGSGGETTTIQTPGRPIFACFASENLHTSMLAIYDMNFGLIHSEEGYGLGSISWRDNSIVVSNMNENRRYDVCILMCDAETA